MKARTLFFAFILCFVLGAFPSTAYADGLIIPDPPPCDPAACPPGPIYQLSIKYHHVTVTIEDQIAVTHVDQVFFNPTDLPIEGTYVFPLPSDAVVTRFTLWIDGKPVDGEVLDAEKARQMYEEIVRKQIDPALLEYIGRGAVRAHIFPVPPQSERRIELEYSQALTSDNGLVRYIYPLNTEKFSSTPLESVTIRVDIRSGQPIRAVYSPSHAVGVSKETDRHYRVGYEASNVTPDTDFALYYSIGQNEALHLLTYRDPGDPLEKDGFFMLLLAPRPEQPETVIPKDVLLVLDRSGSMDGEKFSQAQAALRYILDHLNPQDRFNIITFSTGVESYASGLRPASEVNEAQPWLSRLFAEGSTDINRALLEAASMVKPDRPAYVIFLTDGLPTEGVIDSQKILANFADTAPQNLRLFSFGVGYDVDTILLDSLSQEHQGLSTYVKPGEALDEILSGFYAKISTPVLTNLNIDYGDAEVYDIYPNPLPDLFLGSQVVVVGRYRNPTSTDITLTGQIGEDRSTFTFESQSFTEDSRADPGNLSSIPRLWATRKIGFLLNKIRLSGPDQETIDQIVKLSIRFGIVTPYTSFLVTEDQALGADVQDRIAEKVFDEMQAAPTAAPSGMGAVQSAEDQAELQGAESALPPSAELNTIQIVGSRTFVLIEDTWTDTSYDPAAMQTVKVAFLSDDYFTLIQSSTDLAAYFAIAPRVIALHDGVAYEVVATDEQVPPLQIQPTATTVPGQTPAPTSTPPLQPTPQAPGFPVCGSALIGLAGFGILLRRKLTNR